MSIVLWIIQIILVVKLVTVSYTHSLRQTQPTMQEAIQKMGNSSQTLLYIIAIAALIGSVGLTLPTALGILTWITPLTAVLVSVMMLLSIVFHIKSREKPNVFAGVVLAGLAIFVAYGRWVLVPL